jgi:hypothetical protein
VYSDLGLWFLAAAIILFSNAIYSLYKRQLGLSGRVKVTFEIIIGIISLVGFVFPGLPGELRYIIAGVGAAVIIGTAVIWKYRPSQEYKVKLPLRIRWMLFTLAKGNPDIGIFKTDRKYEYNSRSELPAFDKMLSIAYNTIEISGLDLQIIVIQYIHKDIQVTFLLRDPNSKQDTQYHNKDLKESINKSIQLLYKEKEK